MQNIHIEVKSATEAEGYFIGLIVEGARGELPIQVDGIEMTTESRPVSSLPRRMADSASLDF